MKRSIIFYFHEFWQSRVWHHPGTTTCEMALKHDTVTWRYKIHIRGIFSAHCGTLLYHHLIYEHAHLSEEAPYPAAGACLHMVCTCSSIRIVAITVSSRRSFADRDYDRRWRIIPFWRLCIQRYIQRSICDLDTRFHCNSLANHRRGSHPTSRTWCRAHRHYPFDLWRQ